MSNSLNSNVDALFGKLENFVTTKTVVGEPVFIGGVILMPLVDVTFGVAAGADNKNGEKELSSDRAGGALGAKITPSAVLVIHDGDVQLVNIKNQDSINKLIDMAPGLASKLNLDKLFKKKTPTDKIDESDE